MATKPFVTRAEQPIAPDLNADRSIFHRGSSSFSSSGRRDLVFVVNPRGSFLVPSFSASLLEKIKFVEEWGFYDVGFVVFCGIKDCNPLS